MWQSISDLLCLSFSPLSTLLSRAQFCRTQRDVQPSEVRPLAVLRRTVHHLLSILPPSAGGLPSAYPFLCDRFRAVRQEMVMQGIGGQHALELLLPMVSLIYFLLLRGKNNAQTNKPRLWLSRP